MRTDAVLFTAKNQVEFGQVDVPDPTPCEVVIETRYSWISNGTEGSFLRCERVDGITPWQEGLPLPFPMVPGYQKVGVVTHVGSEVTNLKCGQWVFTTTTPVENVHLGFGGHVAYGKANAGDVYLLPEDVEPLAFSGMVLTQVGYNTGARAPVDAGCHALVIGDGMVGLWAAQTLQHRGAHVALVGKHDLRLRLFRQREGDLALKAQEPDWLAHACEWAQGEFQMVVDTVGNEVNYETNLKLIPLLSSGGHFVSSGHEGTKAMMDLRMFIYREATIHLPCGWKRPRMEQTLKLIHEGTLQTLPLITHRLPAREAATAWEKIFGERDKTLGVILEWK